MDDTDDTDDDECSDNSFGRMQTKPILDDSKLYEVENSPVFLDSRRQSMGSYLDWFLPIRLFDYHPLTERKHCNFYYMRWLNNLLSL